MDDRIVLGSGTLYCMIFTGTIPVDTTIEAAANKLGDIKGGATLEYKPSYYDAVDDSGKRRKSIITGEEAKLKSGIMTWNGNTLKKLSNTARVTEAAGRRTIKIGGINNQDGYKYLLRFVHEDATDGDCRVTIVGTNRAGFTLAFVKDKETVVDAEFTAEPCDDDGTLIIYDEEIIPEQELTVVSAAGSTTGTTILTVTPALGSGNSYKYIAGLYVVAPAPGDTLTGYTAWNGIAEITVPTGYTIIVAEVNASGTCVKYGSVSAVSKS